MQCTLGRNAIKSPFHNTTKLNFCPTVAWSEIRDILTHFLFRKHKRAIVHSLGSTYLCGRRRDDAIAAYTYLYYIPLSFSFEIDNFKTETENKLIGLEGFKRFSGPLVGDETFLYSAMKWPYVFYD